MLVYDPEQRISAREALRHPYFAAHPVDLQADRAAGLAAKQLQEQLAIEAARALHA